MYASLLGGSGDLVSRFIMGISRVAMWVIGFSNLSPLTFGVGSFPFAVTVLEGALLRGYFDSYYLLW